MKREQYLAILEDLLSSLSYEERREIMYDYETHFDSALAEGKTESEIIAALNKPEIVAAHYVKVEKINQSQTNSNVLLESSPEKKTITETMPTVSSKPILVRKRNGLAVMIIVIFLLLILTSMLISPYITFWVFLLVFFAVALVALFGGFSLLISTLISTPLAFLGLNMVAFEHPIFIISISSGLLALGGLGLIATYFIGRGLTYLAYFYFRWCFKSVRGY